MPATRWAKTVFQRRDPVRELGLLPIHSKAQQCRSYPRTLHPQQTSRPYMPLPCTGLLRYEGFKSQALHLPCRYMVALLCNPPRVLGRRTVITQSVLRLKTVESGCGMLDQQITVRPEDCLIRFLSLGSCRAIPYRTSWTIWTNKASSSRYKPSQLSTWSRAILQPCSVHRRLIPRSSLCITCGSRPDDDGGACG